MLNSFVVDEAQHAIAIAIKDALLHWQGCSHQIPLMHKKLNSQHCIIIMTCLTCF